MKPLLTVDELISHMENKGISFNICCKDEAREFLSANNYYLKLASYRNNYKKYPPGSKNEGKYIDLDFAYLRELSTIDMHLRYIIMQMSLDIEHYLKVKLLSDIENNPHEDGYRIIQEFIAQDNDLRALKKIQRHKSSDYCKSLIEKYYPYFPAWVFVELISFGDLAHLCDFYSSKYNTPIADRILLNSVRDIRNASAHSNCLINRLLPGNNTPHHAIVDKLKSVPNIGENARNKKLRNKCVYDFVALLFAYDEIVTSASTKEKRYEALSQLFNDRMLRHGDWFEKNNLIVSTHDFCKNVLDIFLKT